MKRLAFSLVALFSPALVYAQDQDNSRLNMERSISSYWSVSPNILNAKSTPDSIEMQIFNNHNSTLPVSYTEKSNKVRQDLELLVDQATDKFNKYKRVTCSDVECEIVIVFPDLDPDSSDSKSAVNKFYNGIYKSNNYFRSYGPSMILEGSNTNKGFSMVHFVKIS